MLPSDCAFFPRMLEDSGNASYVPSKVGRRISTYPSQELYRIGLVPMDRIHGR